MSILLKCQICGAGFKVFPARKNAKFCSNKCRGIGRAQSGMFKDDAHPRWLGGERSKICEGCGCTFNKSAKQPITSFVLRKFCSKSCADKNGKRLRGEENPKYKSDARRRNRCGKHGSWSRAVISRDDATCQKCGARNIELHAHHIKPYAEYPELRWEISNGLTLCYKCHWEEHTALNANAVNSVNTLTCGDEGNTEPSSQRKPIEGVTTRGRAYRRWNGSCDNCKAPISKRWSDTVGKKHLFCSKRCMGNYNYSHGIAFRGSKAVISSTNSARESDDIV